jgi:hypothetical protein
MIFELISLAIFIGLFIYSAYRDFSIKSISMLHAGFLICSMIMAVWNKMPILPVIIPFIIFGAASASISFVAHKKL